MVEELNFDPKFIMKKIMEVYIHFSKYESFIMEVLNEETWFSFELFEVTANKLEEKKIIDQKTV